jgi:ubiquinone/menaquinone biosynthesis C-methylase UbiE
MVTTICFVDDVHKSLDEIRRILKPGGFVVIAFVDKNSPVGKMYLAEKEKSIFYKDATFFSTEDVYNYLWEHDFEIAGTLQTVFGNMSEIDKVQEPKKEYGDGSFVVVKAVKKE